MSHRAQITQQAARDGVPAPAVERDYVLAHIIAGLGSLGDRHGLVFKGGTALQRNHEELYKKMLKRSHVEVAKKRRTCKFTSQSINGGSVRLVVFNGP